MSYEQQGPLQADGGMVASPACVPAEGTADNRRAVMRSPASLAQGGIPRRLRRALASGQRHRWFNLLVFLPTLVTGLYYGLVASDQYVSEAKFIIRSAEKSSGVPGLAGLLQGAGLTRASEDTYAVQDYLTSRDALAVVDAQVKLRRVYGDRAIDFLSRFPGVLLYRHGTFEDLYRYFSRHINVIYDETTGITTLQVFAFRPDVARGIAEALLGDSEKLVNRLNVRAEADALGVAHHEVDAAEARLSGIQKELTAFRDREQMLDPESSSKPILAASGQLLMALAATQTQITHLETALPESPDLPILRSRVAALMAQIRKEDARVAGSADSMVPKIAQFEALTLQRDFAEKELASALVSLEQARHEAERQQLFLERIVAPNIPDRSFYPRRLINTVMVFVTCTLFYGIGWLLIAGIREHDQ